MWSHRINSLETLLQIGNSKRLRTAALVCAVFLVLDLILYAVLIVPAAARLRNSESAYADCRRKRTEAVLFEKQRQELAGIGAGIPTQKDMPLLIKELVQGARRLNLSVSGVTYDIPQRSGNELAVLSFLFPVEGRYADVKRFIYEVETSDRPIGIEDLKLEEENGRVKMQMKLMTYVKG